MTITHPSEKPVLSIALPDAPSFGAPVDQHPCPELLSFLATRRSASAVTLAEPTPGDDDVAALIRLAARAPDHGKLAPWRFIVLRGENKAAYAARLEALAQGRGDARAAASSRPTRSPHPRRRKTPS